MKLNSQKIEIELQPKNLMEGLLLDEYLEVTKVKAKTFLWHYLLKDTSGPLAELEPVARLKDWGITFDSKSLSNVEHILKAKRKRYKKSIRTIEEIRSSSEYDQALSHVRSLFGHTLQDGTRFYDYQLQDIALAMIKPRLLLCYAMGLGKTRTSLAASLANPKNKKILVVTMSRNLNDWVREIKNIGFEDDFIILKHPRDLRSSKRIHLVSYENWANKKGKTVFRRIEDQACPACNITYKNLFFRKARFCTHCHHKADPTQEQYSEKHLPEFCQKCNDPWKKGALTCTSSYWDKGKLKKCNFSVIEESYHSLSDFYQNHLYDASIIDEIQLIKNGQTRRSQSVRKIKTPVKIGLSGTPAENGTADLFWILGWMTDFSNQYDNPRSTYYPAPFRGYGKTGLDDFTAFYGGGKQQAVLDIDAISTRASNHQQLWALLDTLMVRRKKSDDEVKVNVFIPKPIHHRYHVEMDQAERELYDFILDAFAKWYAEELAKKQAAMERDEKYKISTIEICSWMRKLQQAASCPWIFKEYDATLGIKTAKYRYMETKIMENLKKGKKVLVFSGHKQTVEQLALSLDHVVYGKEVDYIHGSVKKEERWKLIERFQDPNDPLSVLVLSHGTGAESYTLTQAKSVFLFDLCFNGKKMEQCYSRAVRITQKDRVDVYWLMNSDTIDCNIHALNLSKISGVDSAIDRKALDFNEISKEFEGDLSLGSHALDYEEFAKNMLAAGTKREEYTKYA